MSQPSPTPVQRCLDRLRAGDPKAREDLIAACQERVRGIVRALMARFPAVRRWEQSDDVLNEALMRLHHALDSVKVDGTRDLLALAAQNVRWILLDLARKFTGPEGFAMHHATPPPGSAHHPEPLAPGDGGTFTLADWAEFHEQAARLPEECREVFELRWYHGLTHAEVAGVLDISEKTAKRRWMEARQLLGERLAPFSSPDE
ncbi:MAG: RNA polymerase sigma factor [Gemmataceae bacterium]